MTRRYFEAIGAHDVDGAAAMWAPDGREDVRGQGLFIGPEGLREFIGNLVEAIPDLRVEIVSTTAEEDRCALHWRFSGTFAGPRSFNGIAPTGHHMELEGVDVLTVSDGLIQSNEAFTDTMSVARQIGMMPPLGSSAEQRLTSAFNVKTRLTASVGGGEAELVAAGVWVVQGQPGRCNVLLIENGGERGGVTLFDAGARTMTRAVAAAGAKLGGITRVVLGHGHTDHRGVAPALGVPVLCHPDEVQDAEGSGGFRYWPADLAGCRHPQRQIHRVLHRYAWDGGPVKIADTVSEGDEVSGFKRDRPARPRARPDRTVARVRPAGARERPVLHARHVGPQLRTEAAEAMFQLRQRAGTGEHSQARGAGARRRVGLARETGHGRRARPAVERGRWTSRDASMLSVGKRNRRRSRGDTAGSDELSARAATTPTRTAPC